MTRRASPVLRFALAVVAVLGVLLSARTSRASTNIVGGNVINQIWTPAGSPYLVAGDVTVPAGASLTIQAGTVVQMASTDGQMSGLDPNRVEITINGSLAVNGTAASPVTFQAQSGSGAGIWYGIVVNGTATAATIAGSLVENTVYGISANAPGTILQVSSTTVQYSNYGVYFEAGTPAFTGLNVTTSGYGLYFANGAAATVTDCLVYGNSSIGVYVASSSGSPTITLTNCTLHGDGSYGIYATGSTATVDVTNSNITGSTYGIYRNSGGVNVSYSNVWGNSTNLYNVAPGAGFLSCNPLYVDTTSNFRLTSNSPSRNAGSTGGDLGPLPYVSDATPGLYGTIWTSTTVAAGVTAVAGDITVAPGVSLVLSPGATLQFANNDIMACGVDANRGELTVNGTLTSTGTGAQPVTLTSTGSGSGVWYGLILDPNAVSSSVVYTNVDNAVYGLTYAATASSNAVHNDTISTSNYGVYVTGGTPAIDATIVQSCGYGFYLANDASLALTNTIVSQTSSIGVYVASSSGSPTIGVMNCTLYSDGSYGIYATGSTATTNVQNTIITGSTYGIYRNSGGVNVSYSDVWGNSTNLYNVASGAGVISQNPNFVSTPSNLQLQASSVCIDSGSGTGAPNHDILGVVRPQDGLGLGMPKWDMGAYEFVRTPVCGDGIIESGEQCDDGAANGTAGDCCSATCQLLPSTTVCRASSGQCDVSEYCTGTTGACPPDVPVANGTACNDGNACTQTDTCQSGVCTGSNPVTCTALDECHTAGTCNTTSGVCSNPTKPDGTPCSVGTCKSGVCTAPVCGDGIIESPEQCDDGAANGTAGDCCSSTCTFKPAVSVCRPASGQCDLTEYCTGQSAACPADVPAPNGAACDDGNACTQTDTCESGSCTGGNPVTCTAMDQCHDVGTCNPGTGVCSNPPKPDGTACSMGTCQGGTCTAGGSDGGGGNDAGGKDGSAGDGGLAMEGGSPDGGTTDGGSGDGGIVGDAASSGDSGILADASPHADGSAGGGDSGAMGDSSTGEPDGAGSADATANGGGGASPGQNGGCGCVAAGTANGDTLAAIPLLGLAALAVRRRRRR